MDTQVFGALYRGSSGVMPRGQTMSGSDYGSIRFASGPPTGVFTEDSGAVDQQQPMEETEPEVAPASYVIEVETPNGTTETIELIASDPIAEIRVYFAEFPSTCHITCYDLYLGDQKIDDFCEVSDVAALLPDATVGKFTLTMRNSEYDKRAALLHVRRFRETLRWAEPVSSRDSVSMLRHLQANAEEAKERSNGRKGRGGKRSPGKSFLSEEDEDLLTLQSPLDHYYPRGAEHSGVPKCYRALTFSGWNPVTGPRRLQGDLFYLELLTLENERIHITANTRGFFVNSSSRKTFNPVPAPHAYHSASLVDLMNEVSSAFRGNYKAFLRRYFARSPIEVLPVSTPIMPWIALERKPKYDPSRAEDALLTQVDVSESPGFLRDWNDEFQMTRELPHDTPEASALRDRHLTKVIFDFSEAVIQGAVMAVERSLSPINPNDKRAYHMFMFRNVFLSFAYDGAEHYGNLGCDETAYKVVSADLRGIDAVNRANVPGLHTLLTAYVDYRGYRVVAQSIVPGLLQREESSTVPYGSMDMGKTISSDNDMHAMACQAAAALGLQVHSLIPNTAGATESVPMALSLEVKGLKGGDGRTYMMDLHRFTPRDANFPEPEHHSRVLRPELVNAFLATVESLRKLDGSPDDAPSQDAGNRFVSALSQSRGPQVLDACSNFGPDEPVTLNPNVFCHDDGLIAGCDVAKAKALLTEAALFLTNIIIPVLHSELIRNRSACTDSSTLVTLMHNWGVNMRYLGHLCNLADADEAGVLMRQLYRREMITRCAKHLFNARLRGVSDDAVSQTASHFLNALMGNAGGQEQPPADQSRLWRDIEASCRDRFGYDLAIDPVELLASPETLLRSFCLKVGLQVAPRNYDWMSRAPFTAADITDMHPRIRVCLPPCHNANAMMELSAVLVQQGQLPEAHAALSDALMSLHQVYGPMHKASADCYARMANLKASMGKQECLVMQEKAVVISERVYGLDHPRTAEAYNMLAILYSQIGDFHAAAAFVKRAMYLMYLSAGRNRPEYVDMFMRLGDIAESAGDLEAAVKVFESALRFVQALMPDSHVTIADVHHRLAMSHVKRGANREALHHERQRSSLLTSLLGKDDPRTQDSDAWLKRLVSGAVKSEQQRKQKQSSMSSSVRRSKGRRSMGRLPTPGSRRMSDLPLNTIMGIIQSEKKGRGKGEASEH